MNLSFYRWVQQQKTPFTADCVLFFLLISLHIRSMWETICDAQAGFWLNSKFLSKFSRKPLSEISDQKAPPPHSDLRLPKFTLQYPPISENFRFEITKVYSGIPPPPISENFRFEMTKVYSRIPPPFRKTSDLGWLKFTLEYPPYFGKCGRSYVETNL